MIEISSHVQAEFSELFKSTNEKVGTSKGAFTYYVSTRGSGSVSYAYGCL